MNLGYPQVIRKIMKCSDLEEAERLVSNFRRFLDMCTVIQVTVVCTTVCVECVVVVQPISGESLGIVPIFYFITCSTPE